ncbi:MAG TPA: hypothetical protein VFG42_06160 [Baekduia sp.]|uniref:hypothetical protein n=1 Tax=Baekduia sp. TaxID=2600305 RepID=UPI002D781F6D|nr:hypothetical protein [Baekduia sp.]HET6506353.1 hypothetical protein [Baekduia sp.]
MPLRSASRALWARLRPLPLAAALLALSLIAAASAVASPQVRVGIADDGVLLHSPERAPEVVARWKAAGIETVRVQVRWAGIAPDELSPTMPIGFHPTDPYDPRYDWAYLDQAMGLLVANGLTPILSVTGSGPLWSSRVPSLGNPRYQPDPAKFGDFATAVARRYGRVVTQYLIWNEPNQPLWLQPQQECPVAGRKCTPVAPHTYRALVRAAYPAIHRADPGAQVIAGTLAPRGADPLQRNRPLRPLAFIRAFGCVDERFKPVRTGRCRGFQPARIDGFAYHPHSIKASPTTPSPHTDDADLADLGKLEKTLDAVQRARGFTTPTGAHAPLHLTEFGYQTNPPDPYDGIPPARQSRWLQEAAYIAWRDPRVRTLVQYEWQDEPTKSVGSGRKKYAGWQSGLLDKNGRPKPALAGFEHPFFADATTLAPRVRFWGQVRPGTTHRVALQRRSPSGTWVTIARLTTDSRGLLVKTLAPPIGKAATYRYRTTDPAPAVTMTSDALQVTPRR